MYKPDYKIRKKIETPTAHLAYQDGKLIQKWEVSEIRDFKGYADEKFYEEWREIKSL